MPPAYFNSQWENHENSTKKTLQENCWKIPII